MRYYVYRQNNSGGYYLSPGKTVIVRAASVEDANLLARAAGVDPAAPYCDCCGRRWYLFDDYNEPTEGYDVADDLDTLAEWHDVDDATILEDV